MTNVMDVHHALENELDYYVIPPAFYFGHRPFISLNEIDWKFQYKF